MCLHCSHEYLEQGTVESDWHICGICNEQFKSNKLLVYNLLAIFRPRLVGGHLNLDSPDLVFANIAQSDPRSD